MRKYLSKLKVSNAGYAHRLECLPLHIQAVGPYMTSICHINEGTFTHLIIFIQLGPIIWFTIGSYDTDHTYKVIANYC